MTTGLGKCKCARHALCYAISPRLFRSTIPATQLCKST